MDSNKTLNDFTFWKSIFENKNVREKIYNHKDNEILSLFTDAIFSYKEKGIMYEQILYAIEEILDQVISIHEHMQKVALKMQSFDNSGL